MIHSLNAYFALSYVNIEEVIARLAAAAFLAFLLGLDREIHQKSFGLRTHILLGVGTAAFVLVLMEMLHDISARSSFVEMDPSRVIQGIISGIGFMAAGAVIQAKQQIIGATTGAGIWVLGGIGMACGLGMYFHAAVITAIVLFVMVGLHPFDLWLEKKVTKNHNSQESE